MGSLDRPFNPPALALGADATFVARTIDRNTHHMQSMIKRAHKHAGTSFLEIYQNCNIFNDGAFAHMTDKETRDDNVLVLEHKKPMLFGKNQTKGILLDGYKPRVIDLEKEKNYGIDDILIHDETEIVIAMILSSFTHNPNFPDPIGVLYAVVAPVYEDLLYEQFDRAVKQRGKGDVDALLNAGDTWEVK
jgi:2-oxoglutarate ferredoxin oxidoreductase subunit beta